MSKVKWHYHDVEIDERRFDENPITLKDLDLDKPIAKGANAVVYTAKVKDDEKLSTTEHPSTDNSVDSISKYPFAVKMMFNYDIQSNAMAILKAMYRETVPARLYYSNVRISDWEIE